VRGERKKVQINKAVTQKEIKEIKGRYNKYCEKNGIHNCGKISQVDTTDL
jgi:hypothetical protein